MKVDNTALTTHQTCPAKFDLRIRQGWASKGKSAALGFGGALHSGLAEWYKKKDIRAALLAIDTAWDARAGNVDDWRTKDKCITTMIEYSKVYPSESFSVVGAPENPMIEVPFTIELDGLCIPYCSTCDKWYTDKQGLVTMTKCPSCLGDLEPIEYGGIFDGLIEFSHRIFILEHKSTSVLGASYFDQFKPNNQVAGYIWGASKLSGKKVDGALINAIGVYKASKTKFERHITSRSDVAIEEWKKNVQLTCAEIKFHELHGYWPMRTQACTLYGRCEFLNVHELEHEAERQARLHMEYEINPWDYELREA